MSISMPCNATHFPRHPASGSFNHQYTMSMRGFNTAQVSHVGDNFAGTYVYLVVLSINVTWVSTPLDVGSFEALLADLLTIGGVFSGHLSNKGIRVAPALLRSIIPGLEGWGWGRGIWEGRIALPLAGHNRV